MWEYLNLHNCSLKLTPNVSISVLSETKHFFQFLHFHYLLISFFVLSRFANEIKLPTFSFNNSSNEFIIVIRSSFLTCKYRSVLRRD